MAMPMVRRFLALRLPALASLFQLFVQKADITCVMLGGCYLPVQAVAISQHVPYVVGLHQAVSDHAAIEFAVGFYDALGNGESVEFAFELGKTAMALIGLDDERVAILLNEGNLLSLSGDKGNRR